MPGKTTTSGLGLREVIFAMAGLGAWIGLYAIGTSVGAGPYLERINGTQDLDVLTAVKCWAVVLACSTITNVCALTCLASLLGGLYWVATARHKNGNGDDFQILELDDAIDSAGGRTALYVSVTIQGFVVYLVLSSGLFLLGEHPFLAPTQDKYVSLAALASLIGFLGAAQPTFFTTLLDIARSRTVLRQGPGAPP
jgi:hypothetical protein